jgi:hypothetical protein
MVRQRRIEEARGSRSGKSRHGASDFRDRVDEAKTAAMRVCC